MDHVSFGLKAIDGVVVEFTFYKDGSVEIDKTDGEAPLQHNEYARISDSLQLLYGVKKAIDFIGEENETV